MVQSSSGTRAIRLRLVRLGTVLVNHSVGNFPGGGVHHISSTDVPLFLVPLGRTLFRRVPSLVLLPSLHPLSLVPPLLPLLPLPLLHPFGQSLW